MNGAEIIAKDTIAAPITAAGTAAVSIVRISGPAVPELIERICVRSEEVLNSPRALVHTELIDPGSGKDDGVIDSALASFFPQPNSFTGEHCAEFNLHGSPYLVARLFEVLASQGVRPARAGEFSERAFYNGKFDLTQVEAIADLIAAESESQANAAREQLQGRLAQAVCEVGEPLRKLLAEIEAYLDFPEEDISPLSQDKWAEILDGVLGQVRRYIESYRTGRLYREGAKAAIVGLPNAGKSQLLNTLLGEERVIVTPTPGTTRDSVEEAVSINGLRLRLMDTAGLAGDWQSARTPDEIEVLGIEHSWKRIEQADLVLYVLDTSSDAGLERSILERVSRLAGRLLVAANKCDLLERQEWQAPEFVDEYVLISALNGDGLDSLRQRIYAILIGEEPQAASVMITTARHVEALKAAGQSLSAALEGIAGGVPAELVSADIRSALFSLEEIVGVTATEDILGRIFSKFCIGK